MLSVLTARTSNPRVALARVAFVSWLLGPWFGCVLDRHGRSAPAGSDAGGLDAAPVVRDAGADAFVSFDAGPRDAGGTDAGFDACMPEPETCNAADDDCDTEPDEDACGTCVRRIEEGRLYLFCDTALGWIDAREYCRARSYELLIVESAEEQAFVWSQASAVTPSDWWLGLEDMAKDGDYYWVDGTPCWLDGAAATAFTDFRDGRPEDVENQDCVELDLESGGKWADGECEQLQPFVCEAPL
jgi:hypothetical protein